MEKIMENIYIDSQFDTKGMVLFITDDLNLINEIKKVNLKGYRILFLGQKDIVLMKRVINTIDLIVFDNRFNELINFVKFYKDLSVPMDIPLSIIEENFPNDLGLYKYINTYLIFSNVKNIKEIISSIDLYLYYLANNEKIYFNEAFYFNISKNLLFKNKKIICLTKLELKLIQLLIENINSVVPYEKIASSLWENKPFSIFTLRNIVKHIREKTTDKFIQNISNKGYMIKSL